MNRIPGDFGIIVSRSQEFDKSNEIVKKLELEVHNLTQQIRYLTPESAASVVDQLFETHHLNLLIFGRHNFFENLKN